MSHRKKNRIFKFKGSQSIIILVSFSVGIDNPTIEVRFNHLNIDAEAYVGNRGIPTFLNFFVNKISVMEQSIHSQSFFSAKLNIFVCMSSCMY